MHSQKQGAIQSSDPRGQDNRQSPLPPAGFGHDRPPARLIRIIFVSAAVLLAASMIFIYWVGLNTIRAQETMAGHLRVLQQVDDFFSRLKDAETGQRGYLLTGEDSYLLPYTNSRRLVQGDIDALQKLAQSGDLSRPQVEKIAALTDEKLSELAQTIELRRAQGLDAALVVVRSNQGKRVMDLIRDQVGLLHSEEEKEFEAAGAHATWSAKICTAVFIMACGINLAFLAWASKEISREVHLREAARLETARQKELIDTTLSSIGDAVIVTDDKGHVTFLNTEAERLTRWKCSEAVGQPLPSVFRIVNEQTRQTVENPVEKVYRTGKVVGLANHTILIGKDGTETPIDDSAAPIRVEGGPIFGVVLIFRDVYSQRKAQLASERLAAIVEHSGDAMFTMDLEGNMQTWNASAERLFGYSAAEIVGQPVAVLRPPDRLNDEDHIMGRLREGRHVERFETIRLTKDGRRIPVSISVSPLRNAEGEIVGASKIVHDITDLVAARELILREKQILEATVAERTAKLQETVNELQSFSYSIAHDMRAPLRAMGTFAQILVKEMPVEAGPEIKMYCDRIMIGAARLDHLINDALDYTKASLKEFPLLPVDLSAFMRGLISTYPNLHADGIHIQIDGDLPVVLGNESLLTQCFSNLLGNAVKFVLPGAEPRVRVFAHSQDGVARITVADEGIGIPKHAHSRLFVMFQKFDPRYEGTGIGLAIVKKAVERMGGKVGVDSEPDKGSRFWVELRIAPDTENK